MKALSNLEIEIGKKANEYFLRVDGVEMKGVYDVRVGVEAGGVTEAVIKVRCPKLKIAEE